MHQVSRAPQPPLPDTERREVPHGSDRAVPDRLGTPGVVTPDDEALIVAGDRPVVLEHPLHFRETKRTPGEARAAWARIRKRPPTKGK